MCIDAGLAKVGRGVTCLLEDPSIAADAVSVSVDAVSVPVKEMPCLCCPVPNGYFPSLTILLDQTSQLAAELPLPDTVFPETSASLSMVVRSDE